MCTMYADKQESIIPSSEWRNDCQKIVFCFLTFSLSLYNDLKVLKTGGQPLLKFILKNLSKHSLNFSPWEKKILLTYIYPDNSNNAYFNLMTGTHLFKNKEIVHHTIIFISYSYPHSPDKKFSGSLLGTSPLGYLVQASS